LEIFDLNDEGKIKPCLILDFYNFLNAFLYQNQFQFQ